jgi:PH (Pleckstrin Homology) domain-containing protein
MDTQLPNPTKTFHPRPSYGWAWLVLMSIVISALAIIPALATGLSSTGPILTLIICVPVAIGFLVLAVWFPTMRYELDQDQLTLCYGPFLTYQIPLDEIRTIRRRNLGLTIWSTIRFPGIALFKVPYADVGNVKMCATAALNNILLIETDKDKYGLTPADEEVFVAAVRSQLEHK